MKSGMDRFLPFFLYILMNLSILFWNCQGVSSPVFRRTFVTIDKIYNPDIVAILEPKISGVKADNFIKHSGLDFSHREEAEGFAEGIWILWKEGFRMEFIFNHKQFIHFKVTDSSGNWS